MSNERKPPVESESDLSFNELDISGALRVTISSAVFRTGFVGRIFRLDYEKLEDGR